MQSNSRAFIFSVVKIINQLIIQLIGPLLFAFPFHTSILKPNFHLTLRQRRRLGQLHAAIGIQVGVETELGLELH